MRSKLEQKAQNCSASCTQSYRFFIRHEFLQSLGIESTADLDAKTFGTFHKDAFQALVHVVLLLRKAGQLFPNPRVLENQGPVKEQ
jgi:hypothetical protein